MSGIYPVWVMSQLYRVINIVELKPIVRTGNEPSENSLYDHNIEHRFDGVFIGEGLDD